MSDLCGSYRIVFVFVYFLADFYFPFFAVNKAVPCVPHPRFASTKAAVPPRAILVLDLRTPSEKLFNGSTIYVIAPIAP